MIKIHNSIKFVQLSLAVSVLYSHIYIMVTRGIYLLINEGEPGPGVREYQRLSVDLFIFM